MRVGISGLPYCGKSTIFNALRLKSLSHESNQKSSLLACKVKDSRLDELGKIFSDKKIIYPELSFLDVPSASHDNNTYPDFQALKDADSIVGVLRAFEREDVLHLEGSIDPIRDIDIFEKLLIEQDLSQINSRMEKVELELKKGRKDNQKEFDVLSKLKSHLEENKLIRNLELSLDDERLIRGFKFLSIKPICWVANLGEEKKQDYIDSLKNELGSRGIKLFEFYGRVELEIEELEDEQLKDEFLKDLGISLSGLEIFIKTIYDNIGLITFFTIGDDQVRGWPIISQTKAPQAAGKVHSDMERGFIKAEVVEYFKFKDATSFNQAKTKGYLRQESKGYIVQDADVINFKFSV